MYATTRLLMVFVIRCNGQFTSSGQIVAHLHDEKADEAHEERQVASDARKTFYPEAAFGFDNTIVKATITSKKAP